jgi:hypothetical protein
MGGCTATWPPALLEPYDVIAARVKGLGTGFLHTRGWFCFQRRCPPVIARTIVYRDYHHVTAAYTLRLTGIFRAALLRAVRRG